MSDMNRKRERKMDTLIVRERERERERDGGGKGKGGGGWGEGEGWVHWASKETAKRKQKRVTETSRKRDRIALLKERNKYLT